MIRALLLMLFLTSCASQQSWYRYQGFNFTECGPAVSAGAMSFIGVDTSAAEARSYNRSRTFWRLVDIYDHLESRGADPEWRLIESYRPGNSEELSIFYTGIHFVIYYQGIRYDPLTRFSSNLKVPAVSRRYIHLSKPNTGW